MKTTRLFAMFMVIIALTGSTVANAQAGNGRVNQPLQYCTSLPGITEKQKGELTALSSKHTAEMDALRSELWNSSDRAKRDEIAGKMQDLRVSHYAGVQSLLTPEQKEAFVSKCPAYRGRGAGRGAGMADGWYGNGCGRGQGKGNGRGPGRGYGRAGL